MKLSIRTLVSLGAISVLTSGLVWAQTAPATVSILADGTCGMLDATGIGILYGDGVNISANSVNGNVTLVCHAQGERPELGRPVMWNFDNTGIECGTLDGSTKNWYEVVSASGKSMLTCHLK